MANATSVQLEKPLTVYGTFNVGNASTFLDMITLDATNGNLTAAGTKNFRIPHPTKDAKWLQHCCIEAPEPSNIYRMTCNPTEALADFCARLAAAPFITVDTEFMRETTYWPRLCLIQAASADHAGIIDPMAEGLDLEPFLDLLRDPKIIKVFHACRQDVEIFVRLGAMPKPMFDTQVAAMAAGFGEQVAYDSLVRQMLRVELDKGSRFTDWARRPLSDSQLVYALGDVTHLAALYPKLRDRLKKEGRLDWVMAKMESLVDPALYDTNPENAWKRLKPKKFSAKYLAAFKAVAVWRERAAQERDQPRAPAALAPSPGASASPPRSHLAWPPAPARGSPRA